MRLEQWVLFAGDLSGGFLKAVTIDPRDMRLLAVEQLLNCENLSAQKLAVQRLVKAFFRTLPDRGRAVESLEEWEE